MLDRLQRMITAFADLYEGKASQQLREELSRWESQVWEIYETSASFEYRLRAANALARIWKRVDIMPTLIEGLQSSDPILKFYASIPVGELGSLGAAAVPHLIALLRHDDEGCFYSLIALRGIGKAAAPAVPALIELLRTAKPEFFQIAAAEHAIAALGCIGPEAMEAIPLLKGYLAFANDFTSLPIDDFFHRSLGLASALALFQISGDADAALGVASKMLGDKSPCLRSDAARVLEEIGMAGTEVRGIKGNQV